MQMPQTGFPWLSAIAISASLVGGGMMGAIVTLLVSRYRARRQPIGYSTETIEVFKQNPEFPSMRVFLDIGEDPETGMDHAHAILANFSIIRVKVVNKGNQDIPDFKMGITLATDTDAFDIRVETLDRHHVGEILTRVNIDDTKNELDFSLRPFNRSDAYTINVYVTYKIGVGPIKLSTAHSTRFVEIESFRKTSTRDFVLQLVNVALGAAAISMGVFIQKLFFASPFKLRDVFGLGLASLSVVILTFIFIRVVLKK